LKEVQLTTIIVTWIGGFNGGVSQNFVVGHKMKASIGYEDSGNIPDTGAVVEYKIKNLHEGTSYSIRVKAKNRLGESDYVYLDNVLTNGMSLHCLRNIIIFNINIFKNLVITVLKKG